MAFRFQRANCVTLGAFNIYIIQPQWLTAKQILPSNLEVVIESKMDEPGFRFSSDMLKVRWLITPTRIVIETEDPNQDCGQVMAQLLRWLPETPLVAIGNNTYYVALQAERADLPTPPEYPVPQPLADYSLRQRSFHVGVAVESCVYNLRLSLAPERTELLTNAHNPVGDERGAEFAQEHAKRFMEHRRTGVELARHHLKVAF